MRAKKATMYKQGDSWVVSTWDDGVQMYRLTEGLTYWVARSIVGRANCHDYTRCHHEHDDTYTIYQAEGK